MIAIDIAPMIDVAGTGAIIGERIRSSDYSVKDVTGYLGTDTASVYRYMRGDVLPSTDRLLMLSTLLHVTINDLLAIA